MIVKRYELSDAQWVRIETLLPGKTTDPGRTGSDNRPFVNVVLWVLRSGVHWQDLPQRYDQRTTADSASATGWRPGFGKGCSASRSRTGTTSA